MGIFDNQHNSKCNCPHCRGGHACLNEECYNQFTNAFNDYEDEVSFFGDEENTHLDIESNELLYEIESLSPEDIIEHYSELLEECSDMREVDELLVSFFEDVYAFALQEAYLSDVQTKINLLNLLKNK